MKKRNYIAVIGIVFVAVLTLNHISAMGQHENRFPMRSLIATGNFTPEQVENGKVIIKLDRFEGASSIKEMSDNSVAVIHGSIVKSKVVGTTIDELQFPEVYTIYTVHIEKTLKGKLTSDYIEVRQTGGNWNGLEFEVHGEPLLNENDEVVLFLSDSDESQKRVFGGPIGTYLVKEGKVYNIAELDERVIDRPMELSAKGCTLEHFESLIS